MPSMPRFVPLVLLLASPLAAQSVKGKQPAAVTAPHEDADENTPSLMFGIAGGALSYQGGREEQAMGVVVRWATTPWLSLATTPTMVRVREPSVSGTIQTSSGVVDLPIDATLSHGFHVPWSPGVALGLGISLPLGDTATGFGAGKVGYSVSTGVGFSPSERLWVHLGAGRSLNNVSMRSAFMSGDGWGDASAGVSITERLSLNGGYSTDLGAVDTASGHSTSVNGGFALELRGHTTLNVTASHGVSGLAPRWSLALGIGTAFPYLNHLGAGSPIDQLSETFGGGTHGLGNGNGNGNGSTNPGRGRGRKAL